MKDQPAIYFPGLQVRESGASNSFGYPNFWYQQPKTWNLQSKISKQEGRHYLKTGGEYRDQRIVAARPRGMNFAFNPNLTADTFINPNTRLRGDGWGTFLLGTIDDASQIQTIPIQLPRVEFLAFYVQDDFKVSQRLTLNLGLRYEFETPMRDSTDRLSRFLDLSNPIPEFQTSPPQLPADVSAIRKAPPVYNGAWVFTDSGHRGSWDPQKMLFLPRAGLAYRVNDRTALRVGYARFVVPPIMTDGFGILGSVPYPGFDALTKVLPSLQGIPQSVLGDPFPASRNPLIPPVGKTLGRYTNLGGDTTWFHQDFHGGVNDRFNISLQRQLPSRILLDATYFLNVGRNHPYESYGSSKDWNQVDPQYGYTYKSQLDRTVPNPFYNLPKDKFPGQLRNQATVSIQNLLKPYPQYGRLVEQSIPNVHERYQALQLKVQRAFANGFNLLAAYNYNRERREEFFNSDDTFLNRLTWQDGNLPRHRLRIAGIYEFPFGRGRQFLSHMHPIADTILGGWTSSGIFSYNSGDFLRFGAAIVNGNPAIDNPSRDRMFDTSKFTRQPAFTPRTNPLQYSGVKGPRFANLDLTLAKSHKLTERLELEIRMEAYNVSNSFMSADPDLNVDSSTFGRSTAQKTGFYGRQFQYSARLRW